MDKELYIAEGFRQLHNPKYYKLIHTSTAPQTASKIHSIIQLLHTKGVINTRQYRLLAPTTPQHPRNFYLLPKVHKHISKWPHPRMPEGRPIVSDCGSETYEISRLIDYFLQPLAKTSPAYIKDTYHFIQQVKGARIPAHAFLVTGDVTALYTNMDIDRSIEAVREIFRQHPVLGRPDEELLLLLELALRNNEFQFAGKLFLQILGTAMGKAFAPSLANIYLKPLDLQALAYDPAALKLFFRFIDDIFHLAGLPPGTRNL